jgi:pSer/pThr/pTyr-binding forkhead associated (FHA) protein
MGALFCVECGAQLITIEPRTDLNAWQESKVSSITGKNQDSDSLLNPESAHLYLQIMENGKILALDRSNEFTIGRVDDGQPIIPDIDLTPYNGYGNGVSRLHATIHFMEGSATVIDLGSVNGTFVNGKKVSDQIPEPLNHGDVLTLGKMQIKVIMPD